MTCKADLYPRIFLGLLLIIDMILASRCGLTVAISVPLGRYFRIIRLAFSTLPFCHEL